MHFSDIPKSLVLYSSIVIINMGCLKSTRRLMDLGDLKDLVKRAIDLNNPGALGRILKDNPSYDVDEVLISSKALRLNPLAYALFMCKIECFSELCTKLGADIQKMERLLNFQGYRSIDLICIQGTLPMLEVYLPGYLKIFSESTSNAFPLHETLCLDSSPCIGMPEAISNTPIQLACIHNNLNIIQYLQKFFKNKTVPSIFDVNFQDELNGENCPLIACRIGSYHIMRYLYEKCRGNFHVINKRDENAILVLAAASNKQENYDYFVCLQYLLEVIKIDPVYRHEEVVLVINNYRMLELYYKALEPYGIYPNKEMLERLNQVKVYETWEYGNLSSEDVSERKDYSVSSAISSIKNLSASTATVDNIFGEILNNRVS